MSDLPKFVRLNEEGPREGFQVEKDIIPTERKIRFINALSKTGLRRVQIVSFVSPTAVPNMADAENVVAGIELEPNVAYTGLWLNAKGFKRAVDTGRLAVSGTFILYASELFLFRNQRRSADEYLNDQIAMLDVYNESQTPVTTGVIAAAFGCNFQGDIPPAHVLDLVKRLVGISSERGIKLTSLMLNDTMGWATPHRIKKVVGLIRDAFPSLDITLHLHDTRGMAIGNAYSGLEMGVSSFDASVGGLGGCPFAGKVGASGNMSSEEFVFLCEELGIETGVDLERLVNCARMAEEIVGHPLPSAMIRGGSLKALRQKIAQSA
jgi:hydroxymethylglutaryl-CoA lyase